MKTSRIAVLFLSAEMLCCATALEARGQYLPCDTSFQLDFTYHQLGDHQCSFTPHTDGPFTVLSYTWSYELFGFQQTESAFEPTIFFPSPGDYLMCLTVVAHDNNTQVDCETTLCHVITIVEDSSGCGGLSASFTIADINGQTITFNSNLSTSLVGISGYFWSFGDGASSDGPNPEHTFAGSGPYLVCLTIFSGDTCSDTECSWFYSGPVPPCDSILHVAFDYSVVDLTVAVFDSSITTGMNSFISWNFGDNSTGDGNVALHTYQEPGNYTICAEVSIWGALAPDTCISMVCASIQIGAVAVVQSSEAGALLTAGPVPFTEELVLDGAVIEPGGQWQLLDALGRVAGTGAITHGSPLRIDTRALPPATYLVRIRTNKAVGTLRVLKQ